MTAAAFVIGVTCPSPAAVKRAFDSRKSALPFYRNSTLRDRAKLHAWHSYEEVD